MKRFVYFFGLFVVVFTLQPVNAVELSYYREHCSEYPNGNPDNCAPAFSGMVNIAVTMTVGSGVPNGTYAGGYTLAGGAHNGSGSGWSCVVNGSSATCTGKTSVSVGNVWYNNPKVASVSYSPASGSPAFNVSNTIPINGTTNKWAAGTAPNYIAPTPEEASIAVFLGAPVKTAVIQANKQSPCTEPPSTITSYGILYNGVYHEGSSWTQNDAQNGDTYALVVNGSTTGQGGTVAFTPESPTLYGASMSFNDQCAQPTPTPTPAPSQTPPPTSPTPTPPPAPSPTPPPPPPQSTPPPNLGPPTSGTSGDVRVTNPQDIYKPIVDQLRENKDGMKASIKDGLLEAADSTVSPAQSTPIPFGTPMVGEEDATASIEEDASDAVAGAGANITLVKNVFDSGKKFTGPSIPIASRQFAVVLPVLGGFTIDINPYNAIIAFMRNLGLLALYIWFWFATAWAIRSGIS